MKRFVMLLAPMCLLMANPMVSIGQERDGDRIGPRDPERRQRIVDEFDADNDGELSRDERAAARESREARPPRNERAGRDRVQGDRGPRPPRANLDDAEPENRPGRRGREARRGDGPPEGREFRRGGPPERRRQGPRPEGRGGPPNLDRLFGQFDRNDDGELSRREFMALAQTMRRLHQGGTAHPRASDNDRQRPPRGPRGDAEGRDRPRRPEGRPGGDRDRGPRGDRPRPALDEGV